MKTGQVVSDVSGVVFGGALERFLTTRTSWLRTPNITSAQRQLPICRNVAMAGAIVGVIIGCALGATSLLFVDLDARHRIERAQQLRVIVNDMIVAVSPENGSVHQISDDNSTGHFACEACTVYIVSTKDLTLPNVIQEENSQQWKVVLKDMTSEAANPDRNIEEVTAVQRCIASRTVTLSDERRIMYAPVIKKSTTTKIPIHHSPPAMTTNTEEVIAVVAFRYGQDASASSSSSSSSNGNDRPINHNNNDDNRGFFSEEDVVTARDMARYIAIFMDRLVD
jgi:Transmembrane protein 65